MIEIINTTTVYDMRGRTDLFDYPNHLPVLVHSMFRNNVLKGLHFQTNPWVRKEVYLLQGKLLDVCVSLHADNTLGKYELNVFDAPKAFIVPCGYAHGVLALSDVSMLYKFIPFWDKDSTISLTWHDLDINIPWNEYGNPDEFILSDGDMFASKSLQQLIQMGKILK